MSKAGHQEDHLHISALGRLSVPYFTTRMALPNKAEKYPASRQEKHIELTSTHVPIKHPCLPPPFSHRCGQAPLLMTTAAV